MRLSVAIGPDFLPIMGFEVEGNFPQHTRNLVLKTWKIVATKVPTHATKLA